MSWTEEAIAYFHKHREYVSQDLISLKSGRISVSELSAGEHGDMTQAWIGRYERQIAHIDGIIKAYDRSNR